MLIANSAALVADALRSHDVLSLFVDDAGFMKNEPALACVVRKILAGTCGFNQTQFERTVELVRQCGTLRVHSTTKVGY